MQDNLIDSLLERLSQGDLAAGEQLAKHLDRPLRAILRTRVPEHLYYDIYQETWTRVYSQLLSGKHPKSLIGWFLGVAYKVKQEYLRSESKRLHTDPNVEHLMANDIHAEKRVYLEEVADAMTYCLKKIPQRYSTFLTGHGQNENRLELCKKTSVNIKNYHRFLHRARDALRRCLGLRSLEIFT